MQLKSCFKALAGIFSGKCLQKIRYAGKSAILPVLTISAVLFSCNQRQVNCISSADFKSVPAQFDTAIYKLHGISRFSFVKSLNYLTYFKGKYYTIDPEKRLFLCYRIDKSETDTFHLYIEKQLALNFKPVDFCVNDNGFYLLSDPQYSSLFHFPSGVMDSVFNDSLTGKIVAEGIYMFPNSRLTITEPSSVTAWFNVYNSEDSYKHFEEYDLLNSKQVSRYNDGEHTEDYFPSMEYPNRLDLDTFSIISYGYKNTILKYNRLTGEIIGEYCAKSDKIDKVNGLTQAEVADVQKPMNFLISSARYLNIFYDHQNGLFLRIAKHHQELRVSGSRRLNKIENAPLSFLLFNQEFVKIGEQFVQGGKLNFLFHFQDKEGIHFLVNEEAAQITDAYLVKFAKLKLQ